MPDQNTSHRTNLPHSGGIPADATMPPHTMGISTRLVYDVVLPEGIETFSSRERAIEVSRGHQNLFTTSKMLHGPGKEHFPDFWNGQGYIQHSGTAVAAYTTAVMSLLKSYEDGSQNLLRQVSEGRGKDVVTQLNATSTPLSKLIASHLSRVLCIDMENREWGLGTLGRESNRQMQEWPHIKYGMRDC